MDVKVIKEIMSAFKEAELTKFEYKCEDFELKLGKEQKVLPPPPMPMQSMQPSMMSVVAEHVSGPVAPAAEVQVTTPTETMKTINSPMVGTFYLASSPKAKPFVEIGTKVKKGDVVCIVEAMKLMNEVEAEVDGEIVEILVNNEDMVEFNQPLFVLR